MKRELGGRFKSGEMSHQKIGNHMRGLRQKRVKKKRMTILNTTSTETTGFDWIVNIERYGKTGKLYRGTTLIMQAVSKPGSKLY